MDADAEAAGARIRVAVAEEGGKSGRRGARGVRGGGGVRVEEGGSERAGRVVEADESVDEANLDPKGQGAWRRRRRGRRLVEAAALIEKVAAEKADKEARKAAKKLENEAKRAAKKAEKETGGRRRRATTR